MNKFFYSLLIFMAGSLLSLLLMYFFIFDGQFKLNANPVVEKTEIPAEIKTIENPVLFSKAKGALQKINGFVTNYNDFIDIYTFTVQLKGSFKSASNNYVELQKDDKTLKIENNGNAKIYFYEEQSGQNPVLKQSSPDMMKTNDQINVKLTLDPSGKIMVFYVIKLLN